MKNQFIPILLMILFIGVAVSFQSCLKDECEGTQTFVQYDPVYKTVDEIRQNIKILPPRTLENPGKIYYYKNHIIVNEVREGLHIINNHDPANPSMVAFIEIPGNVDMAVKNDMLYADNYIDLLTIDISDPVNPVLKTRTEDVFNSLSQNQNLGHLVYYEPTEVTVELDCSDPRWGTSWWRNGGGLFFDTNAPILTNSSGSSNNNTPSLGVAGSMARFGIYQDFLYAIDNSSVDVFDISSEMNPISSGAFDVSWDIETLFPYKENLFIGSQSGMFIYSLSNPANPSYLSKFEHARACDPVFVKDNYAYVTLRDGTPCEGFSNQLDVVDITSLTSPFLVDSYQLDNPHGLSIKDNDLYLCDGRSGLRVLDIEDVEKIREKNHQNNFDAYDAISIPNKEVLLVVGKDGLYQFDNSNSSDLKEISVISINR